MNDANAQKSKKQFIPTGEAAKILHLSPGTLANHRTARIGLPYCKLGGRVLYDISDIEKYLEDHKISHD